MPTWRCTSCSISYPTGENTRLNSRCLKCKGNLAYYTNSPPDEDWREKVGLDEKKEQPQSWGVHPDEDSCPIIYVDNTDTVEVTDASLRKLGYNPRPFDVVKLNGTYYELLDYQSVKQVWTVERFNFEKTLRQIRRAPVYRGER